MFPHKIGHIQICYEAGDSCGTAYPPGSHPQFQRSREDKDRASSIRMYGSGLIALVALLVAMLFLVLA